MIVPVKAISNLVLTQQIYSEETNGAHAHYREPVLKQNRTTAQRESDLFNHEYDYGPNWTTRSSVTN